MNEICTTGPVPADIFITDELAKRPGRAPDYLREKKAIQELAGRLVSHPDEVLPRFVDLAMELTGGIAAGLSLYEADPAPGVFRWRHLRGALASFENATTPRNFSPCGVTLDQNRPVLARHAERFYDWISDAHIEVPEVLLVPLYLGEAEPLGTLWIVSGEDNHFDGGHARIAGELASFVGIALHMMKARQQVQAALEQQETLTREMAHRVKNLFAVAEGLVRMTERTSATKEEMAATLIGRFHALSSAHGLVRRGFSSGDEDPVTDLGALLHAIVKPHERNTSAGKRFLIDGPAVACGGQARNGIALVFHELTTNAAKYGALKAEDGHIDLCWRKKDGNLDFHWVERGGPPITSAPDPDGFGSKLLRDMVARQFHGTLQHEWRPEGLEVKISIPLAHLGA